jgi:hypothetical protein
MKKEGDAARAQSQGREEAPKHTKTPGARMREAAERQKGPKLDRLSWEMKELQRQRKHH